MDDLKTLIDLDIDMILKCVDAYPNDIRDLLVGICQNVESNLSNELTTLIKTFDEKKTLMEQVVFCLNHGANLSISDDNGYNALHWAVMKGSYQVIEALLEKFPNAVNSEVNSTSTNLFAQIKKTPLDLAIENGDPRIIELLIEHGGISNHHRYANQLPISTRSSSMR